MGTRWATGHGAGLAWHRGGFNRKGKSDLEEGPPLTPTQLSVSLLQGPQSHCPSTATHAAAARGLNLVGRAPMATSVLALPLIHRASHFTFEPLFLHL